ncbi:MAG: hypothetical protein ACLSUM_10660 [Dysosmobacter welbionis]
MGILRRAVIVMDENFEPMELVSGDPCPGGAERPGAVCPSRPVGLCQAPGWVKVRAFDGTGMLEVEGPA